jgi:hypothetical protein
MLRIKIDSYKREGESVYIPNKDEDRSREVADLKQNVKGANQ